MTRRYHRWGMRSLSVSYCQRCGLEITLARTDGPRGGLRYDIRWPGGEWMPRPERTPPCPGERVEAGR